MGVDRRPVSGAWVSIVNEPSIKPCMPSRVQIEVAATTDIGRHRKTNADALIADDGSGLFAVADGMGDTPRSGLVAQLALEAVRELFLVPWSQLLPAERSAAQAVERLILGVAQANARLYLPARERRSRAGTTFAGVVVCGGEVCVGHVGDSRVYLLQARTGRLTKLTHDDTIITDALRDGMSWQRAAALPNPHALTSAIGLTPVLGIRPSVHAWVPGDVVLVCTDGITDWLDDVTIARTLVRSNALDAAAGQLVQRALAAGGRDNASVVLARRVA
jgi:protein phosphatase